MKGFYRQDENGNLLYAPNAVYGPHGKWSLRNPNDTREGWRWFSSESQAREAFGLPPLEFEQACREEFNEITDADIIRLHRAVMRSNIRSAIENEIKQKLSEQ